VGSLGASLVLYCWRAESKEGKIISKRERRARDDYQCRAKGVFIACEASHCDSNGRSFDSCTPTQERCFENRASCTDYLDGQANCTTFQRKVYIDVMTMQ
jgi:hypothetical protein